MKVINFLRGQEQGKARQQQDVSIKELLDNNCVELFDSPNIIECILEMLV